MRIDEKIVRSGYFWLSENEDTKIPGTISIREGGKIELEIVGHFTSDFHAIGDNPDLSRILGNIEKSGYVTLENCFYLRKNHSFLGVSKSTIHVRQLLTRVAYDKQEIIEFDTFNFSIDCLDEWVNICGTEIEHDWKDKTANIKFSAPSDILAKLDNGLELAIRFTYSYPSSASPTGVGIRQSVYLELKSDKPLPLKDFISVARQINNLLCFAIDATVSLKDVVATSDLLTNEPSDGEKVPINVEIYYPSLPHSETKPEKHLYQMLFGYKAIEESFERVVNSWLTGYENHMAAVNLYFSSKQGAYKYLEGKFLSLVQGLETYHRRISNENLMEQSEYESLVSELLSNCPGEQRAWLEGRLQHGNEINLRKRITRIIEPFKSHLGNSNERRKLVHKIVDTRNYLTHYDESLKNVAANGLQLHELSVKIEAIFQLHFLMLIGLENQQIVNIIEKSHTLKSKLDR